MPKLKIGVVGFGKLGLLHCGMMNGLKDSIVTAVADPSSTSLSMLKSQMPAVNIFSNHKEMIQSKLIDAAFICTPTGTHIDIASDFHKARVPFFIEKPLSTTFEECIPLLDMNEKAPLVNMVGYMSRYVDTFMKAREILKSGVLGKIQMVHATMYIGQLFSKGKGWRYSKKQSGGGVLITQNSHLIDMLVWYFGSVKEVSARTRALYSAEVEDWFNGFIDFNSGISCSVDTSWSKRHHRTLSMKIEVQGENGTVTVNEDEIALYLIEAKENFASQWTVLKKPDLYSPVELDVGGQHYCRQAAAFLDALKSGINPESDLTSAAYVQKVIESLYASADAKGSPIIIESSKL